MTKAIRNDVGLKRRLVSLGAIGILDIRLNPSFGLGFAFCVKIFAKNPIGRSKVRLKRCQLLLKLFGDLLLYSGSRSTLMVLLMAFRVFVGVQRCFGLIEGLFADVSLFPEELVTHLG
ncbi:hypothetical protein PanWU01x14_279420 [Parasponia andersonii]|uniref:Uncharacterized protein n=1 Tax=Parasponia andersonii TaxID=3476 RepID=A0A2P5B1W5_PARAD|nr:hypothetical protein PanWU01x14_279420 [Parasponia andersonii]